jgi:olefin beta-lactone synthetase
MTEALPVADIDLVTINGTGPGRGVNVGHPVQGARVRIDPLSDTMGRVLVSAPWLSDGYDGLWATEASARSVDGGLVWHDSGDVGHLDTDGSLWIEGRGVHIISTVTGLLTPVPIEVEAETVPSIGRAAAVGVGPIGVQHLVIVVEVDHDGLAPAPLADAMRQAVTAPVAAVLSRKKLPVDIRHNAKIDRAALAAWAKDVLDGKRART